MLIKSHIVARCDVSSCRQSSAKVARSVTPQLVWCCVFFGGLGKSAPPWAARLLM